MNLIAALCLLLSAEGAEQQNPGLCCSAPALKIIEMLMNSSARVDYSDPYVPKIPKLRKYKLDMSSVPITEETLRGYDCAVIVTDHTGFDYKLIYEHSSLVIDTRNAMGHMDDTSKKVFKA